jgi:beta-lactamase regulating signal transducer with metallopeptidase domain
METFFYFLIESSLCLLFFLTFYKLAISHLTHFNWMRSYLLASLMLSSILPLIKIPNQWYYSIIGPSFLNPHVSFPILKPLILISSATESGIMAISQPSSRALILTILTGIYFAGIFYKSIQFVINLVQIRKSIQRNPKQREGDYWIINVENNIAAYSFMHYIFISRTINNASPEVYEQIKNHECIHAAQRHTIDILLTEVFGILFWFNPLVYYAKQKIREIHEFIADEKTAGIGEKKKRYAELLFKLASESKVFSLSTGFSGNQINKRILMVSKTRSLPACKLIFFAVIPVVTLLLLSFSYLNDDAKTTQKINNTGKSIKENSPLRIGEIKWINNTIINSDGLNKILGLKTGDEYNKENFEKRVSSDMDGISTHYFDKGYLFLKIDVTEIPTNEGIMNLAITIYEGTPSKIGAVSIRGNQHVSTDEILSKISVKPGDLFSKTKIVESVRALANMGKFDNETITPDLTPLPKNENSDFAIVDVVFIVTEK